MTKRVKQDPVPLPEDKTKKKKKFEVFRVAFGQGITPRASRKSIVAAALAKGKKGLLL